jgi:hypothetical protein
MPRKACGADLGAYLEIRERLAAGYDPVGGSKLLADRNTDADSAVVAPNPQPRSPRRISQSRSD